MRTEQRRLRLLSSKLRAESSSRETLDAIIDDRTGHDRVEDAIAGLPEISRRALRLAYGDGLSHRQIAELHGRPLGTIKTVIRNGLRSLRSAVGDGAVSRRLRTARAAAGLAPAVERPFTIDPADDVKPAPAGTQAPVVPRLAGVHVVCVDDDVRTRELLEWVLRSAGPGARSARALPRPAPCSTSSGPTCSLRTSPCREKTGTR